METNSNQAGVNMGWMYALVGVVLFGIGGMVLEDAMGGDSLTFTGCVCVAAGLVGIIAGGVSLGMGSRDSNR